MNAPVPAGLVSSIRLYAEPFAKHPPAIFSCFPGGGDPLFPFEPGSDRGLGILLLCASLHRPGGEARVARSIAKLYMELGNDIFKLNRIPFEDVRAVLMNGASPVEAEGQKQIPGILRSVCDFFYKVGSLGDWLSSASDWETRVREMSEGIYWMGKLSRWRTKPRYFLWLASFQPGFAARFPQACDFFWPAGEGHARFYHDILSPAAKKPLATDAETRLRYFTEVGRQIFPLEPWKLFQPLDAYLRPEKEEYLCREIQGGCRSCSLKTVCPAARHFGVSG